MAKSTAKLKKIGPGEVGAYMNANGLSSIVAYDEVDGWIYRLKLYESEGKKIIGANLIICSYDESTQKYNLVSGSELGDSVTKVQNLPCSTLLNSKSTVDRKTATFLGNLMTDYYGIDKVTPELRTNNIGDGSSLTYDDLDVSVWVNDEE